MAYKRRYLSGQEAVTVDIGQGAVTADKILPGAVGSEALAPDSVSGEKIIAGTIETSDLKDGLITPEKLAPNAVETEAIKDGAVTAAKIDPASGIPTRPLSPGLATAEIADEAVDHSKLKPECVESDSIKPGAVDNSAVAHDAIDDDKIADDAVQAEHVENGAIVAGKCGNDSISESCLIAGSVTNLKLGVGAVAGDRVADLGIDPGKLDYNSVADENIQTAALAKRHLSSKRARLDDVDEKFVGGAVPNGWQAVMDAGGGVVPHIYGGLSLYTGNVIGDKITLSGGPLVKALEGLPVFDAQVRREQTTDDIVFIGAEDGDGNRIGFERNLAHGNNHWWARDDYADGAVLVDLDLVATHDIFWLLGFEMGNATTALFYLDGILKATIPSTVPANKYLFPVLEIETIVNSDRILWVRYLSLLGDRP